MDSMSNLKQEIAIISDRNQVYPRAPRPDEEFYDKHSKRGMALIFNHKDFQTRTKLPPRNGTEKDGRDLKNLLLDLKFEVHLYEDLQFDEIQEKLSKVAATDHSNSDCILVAVMTHGENGILYAKNTAYPTKNLWTKFSPLHCPSLAGKPKLFLIQACRGDKTDPGILVTCDSTDSHQLEEKMYTIPVMADFLFMYATFEGYCAWRDEEKGSPFIQALVNQFRIHHKSKDFLSILTHVNREVAIGFSSESKNAQFHDKKEMCSIISMLTRIFYVD